MKLGSLFDGSGGFPLAGVLCGLEPIWASEIEPYPIAVTTSRFPNMKHLGDISKINGAEIEPVDVITFGSPCQDLSVAGKRAGLKHENNGDDETTRSGLFMEAVRIIKEMREKTNGEYPRYAVWENVPGAFSSNKGEDFRIVLEELVKVVEPTAVMPEVPRFGWAYADSYCGDGWSLAYRVLDAQYWGVPQRRRRIYLVADFGGQRAREILFEREGLRGYFTEGRTPWKAVTADAERSVGADDREGEIPYTLKIRSGVSVDSYGKAAGKGALIQKNLSATLGVSQDQYLFQPLKAEMHGNVPCVMESAGFCPEQSAKTRGIGYEEETSPTLRAGVTPGVVCAVDQGGGKSHMKCYDARGNGDGDTVNTITGDHENRITDYTSVVVSKETIALEGNGQCPGHHDGVVIARPALTASKASFFMNTDENLASTLVATDYKDPQMVCYREEEPIAIDRAFFNQGKNALYKPQTYEDGTVPTLVAKGPGAVATRYIVRRLTPTECARLQGFADRWGNVDPKTDFTDEEYRFWLEVRNTHAAINGKAVKEYTKSQMLTWYNKLHTDSAEYKLWGNGIALPTALYVIQGIAKI